MIKLGNNDITLKVGSTDVSAAYLGSTLVYSGDTPTPPTPSYKWIATYTGGTTSSAECDVSSAITSGEISITNLVSVEIGQCVTSIGATAFRNCTGLTSITIPDSVTSIGGYAFSYCSSLSSITISSGVTSIGAGVFRYCTGLISITVEARTPPTLGSWALFEANDCPIYVPAASVSAYKSASGWSDYASRIQAIPEPSPQWVTFNSGDDISGLNVYGVKGVANDLSNTFTSQGSDDNIYFELSRNIVNAFIGDWTNYCYTDTYGINDNVELIFGNIGCSDYYTLPASRTAASTFQLYIYQ